MKIEIINAAEENAADILKIEKACFSSPWSEKSIAESLNNPASHFILRLPTVGLPVIWDFRFSAVRAM